MVVAFWPPLNSANASSKASQVFWYPVHPNFLALLMLATQSYVLPRRNARKSQVTFFQASSSIPVCFCSFGHMSCQLSVSPLTTLKACHGLIQPITAEGGLSEKKHYKVEFELAMIVDGRNLRYEARWPIGEGSRVQQKGQTCIAAAFIPGTK